MLPFLNKNEEITECFLSVLIEKQYITSVVWKIEKEKIKFITTPSSVSWQEGLTEAIDNSLTVATQNLPDGVKDPEKTVFGISSDWIEEGNIKEDLLLKLKQACKDLSLVPTGFVVLNEAISFLKKTKEQSLFSGITFGVDDQSAELSIFEMGKLMGTTIVSRSISILDDLIEGLTRMSQKVNTFPARIVLYNQKDVELEEIKNSLDQVSWDDRNDLKFVHPPTIEILPTEDKIAAVSLAGGSEIGNVNGFVDEVGLPEDNLDEIPESEIVNLEEAKGLSPEDLGFTVTGSDDHQNKEKVKAKLKLNIPHFKINFPHFKFNILWLGLLPVLALGLFLSWWFLPKADITIYVSPKRIEDTIDLRLDNADIKQTEIIVEKDKTKSTTGIKTIGEKSKGQVKVQNGTATAINLPPGTSLLSSTELKFVTLKQASVSGALSPSSPGTALIDVEAYGIGSEYNIAKGEVLKVSNYPKAEVDATTEGDFSGGSSRQISAVSESDRKTLFEELSDELKTEAKDKMIREIPSEKILLDPTLSYVVDEEDYSNKVGDEATSVKLFLKLKFSAKYMDKSLLDKEARNTLSQKLASGYILRDDQLTFEFAKEASNESLTINVSANLLPDVDTNEIKRKIAGKYPKVVENYLQTISGYLNSEIRMSSLLKGKFAVLPHLTKNIDITFKSE